MHARFGKSSFRFPAVLAALVVALSVAASPRALAWGDAGHRIVAAIAWANMRPETRDKVIALLKNAPLDSDLRRFRPTSGTAEERDRQMFIAASIWPDYVRPKDHPTDKQKAQSDKYHRGKWHYINYFWDYGGPNNTPRDHPWLRPDVVNALERLKLLASNPGVASDDLDPAVKIAWILHLTGDLHQPLHTSARVTDAPDEDRGDQGGNLFKLTGRGTLHGYWDGTPERSIPRNLGESDAAYIDRCARLVMDAYPLTAVEGQLKPGQYDAWVKEGLESSKKSVYAGVRRKRTPPTAYAEKTFEVCKPALAKAGYRLARLLDEAFE
jgi:hypothetical protein